MHLVLIAMWKEPTQIAGGSLSMSSVAKAISGYSLTIDSAAETSKGDNEPCKCLDSHRSIFNRILNR